jgi:hypothetical protein
MPNIHSIHKNPKMDHTDMLKKIIKVGHLNPKFDATTMEGIKQNYDIYGSLTHSQRCAIDNVYRTWEIEKIYDITHKNKIEHWYPKQINQTVVSKRLKSEHA